MRIHWFRAQAPRRVVALAKHLGVEAEYVHVDMMGGGLRTPAYAALNPNLKAPVLQDGAVVLWESSAIMAHLAIRAGADLWPASDPAGQVEVLRWLSWNDGHWAPAIAPFYFEQVVKGTFGLGPPDRDLLGRSVADLERFAKVLDTHLADHPHPALDRLTIADFQLASMAAYWRRAEAPLGAHRHIVRWLDDLMRLPAWADPWPDGVREAM